MATFALITEGITDQAVIEGILEAYCGESLGEEIDVNFLQPIRDATDASRALSAGGWERVLEYCTLAERITEALAVNDYLVVQIDTDCSEHANFGVSQTENGVRRSTSEIVADVRTLIITKFGQKNFTQMSSRIFFAVSVHSLECWLLPLFANYSGKCREMNCEDHLSRALSKRNLEHKKDYRSYRELARAFRKRKDVISAARHSESLKTFLDTLP
ncbi:phage tail protein [Mesorhizobium sp. B2-3-12]|uniref:phage tail protein n=1 Tax=Mesorhizobium sp. B2-3-12 TaxID=2589952 RepID=UPI00112781AE|nr:phage tail protein [Mesorhizobium sp. B2-3-12]TPL82361.1 phage tail protein [Mesorhizobium sp. B2-3-12]